MVVARQRPGEEQPPSSGKRPPAPPTPIDPDRPTRADALRRIAAEVERPPGSGQPVPRRHRRVVRPVRRRPGRPVDLRRFAAPRSASPPSTASPTRSSAGSRLLPADSPAAGMRAISRREVVSSSAHVLTRTPSSSPRRSTRGGIRSVCFAPIIFHDEPARPLRALPRPRPRLVPGGDGPRPRLRRPDGVGRRPPPAQRIGPVAGRPPRGGPGARDPAEPVPRDRRHRRRDRRGDRAADPARHDPRLPGRPRAGMCEPIAFKGVFSAGPSRTGRSCASGSAAGSPAGPRRTTRRSTSATRRPTRGP